MCLESKVGNLQRAIDKLKVDSRGYIKLWKGFYVTNRGNLKGPYVDNYYYEGKNTAGRGFLNAGGWYGSLYPAYPTGFHCYVEEKHAKRWGSHRQTVKTRKSWIVAIGKQCGKTVIVCKHIII